MPYSTGNDNSYCAHIEQIYTKYSYLCFHMKKLNTKEIHEILLGILKDIDAFCTANGITYSVCGGTLLGAVRHKGFIPWDEDVDIVMKRADFERFKATYGNERYAIVPDSITEGSPYYNGGIISKVHDKKTMIYEGANKGIYQHGLFVDIFPMDGLPEDKKARKAFLRKASKIRRRIALRHRPIFNYGFHRSFDPVLAKLESKFHSLEYWRNSFEELTHAYPYESSKWVGCISGIYKEREAFPAEMFNEYIRLPFEDTTVSAIAQWDKYLTQFYGDYMTPPPAHKKKDHHRIEAFLLED